MIHREKTDPKSWQIMREVIDEGDCIGLSRRLFRSRESVLQWRKAPETPENPNARGRFNPLDILRTIIVYCIERDGSPERASLIAMYVSWLCWGFHSPWPKLLDNLDMEVVDHLQANWKEFHEMVEALRQAWENDRKISVEEAIRIKKEALDLMSRAMGTVFWALGKAGLLEEFKEYGYPGFN